jgi:hypothetical protein
LQNRALARVGALLTPLVLSPAVLASDAGGGFSLATAPYPGLVLARSLSTGEIVTFDQKTIELWDESGAHLLTLATFSTCDPFIFPPGDCLYPGVFEIDPSESFVLFGDSSFGDIARIALDGSGSTPLATIGFNYDAAFESATTAIVSASAGGSNQLYRLDVTNGATQLLADVAGFSGPVAVDVTGNLFYGSQSSDDVLLFFASQIAAPAQTLLDSDALVFASGFDASSDLVAGPEPFEVYMAESDFGSGASRVWRIGATPATSLLIAENDPFFAVSGLELHGGPTAAAFAPYQPAHGARLGYTTNDFLSTPTRYVVEPARPEATLSGPGLAGVGQVDLAVTGAAPFGVLFVMYGPQATYDANETAHFLGGPPFFTGLAPLTAQLLAVPFFTNASGDVGFPFFNDGSLTGLLALQGAVLDVFGTLSSTTAALN